MQAGPASELLQFVCRFMTKPLSTEPAADAFLTLGEIVRAARARMSRNDWDFLTGGADTETTLKRNRQALDSIAFRPRVLRKVDVIDLTGSLLGHRLRIPVVLAPMGSMQQLDPGGALPAARAAEAFGTLTILSSATLPDYEALRPEIAGPMIYQLYVRGDDDWVRERVQRAVDLGYQAFCLTVDTASYSRRERDIEKRFVPTMRRTVDGQSAQAGMTWELVKMLRDMLKIPLILKGIATAEDATLAVQHGVDVVYVSNHGGRQLDHGMGAIDALPEVVKAVAGRAEIVVDGGFVRGTDIIKALALGADAVGIGKLMGWGLAAGGQTGVLRVLELLETEMQVAMALLGATSVGELEATYLRPARPIGEAGVTSAFPLLDNAPGNG
jgi:isopentenyl diphosphate isomerase/L-lactate dehydrogenase-like FMN-dependent dehydrogenase